MRLQGASVIVTGGASGLGLATAQQLLKRGATVTIVDREQSQGPSVAHDLGARFAAADVTVEADVLRAIGEASATDPVRALVHCAGRGGDRLRIVNRDHTAAELDSFAEV